MLKKVLKKYLSLAWVLVFFAQVYPAHARVINISTQDVAQAIRGYRSTQVMPQDVQRLRGWFEKNKSTPLFAEISWLRAAQNRISFDRVAIKAKQNFEQKNIKWSPSGVKGEMPYQRGQSLFGREDAIPVIIMPDGSLAIIDGHHEVGVALVAGSKQMPIRIIGDLSEKFKTMAEAWQYLADHQLAYFANIDGTMSKIPVEFSDLQDDPNRTWIAMVARRIQLKLDSRGEYRLQSRSSEFDLWVKVGKGIPFIEFILADILYHHGIIYRPDMNHYQLLDLLEQSRKALELESSNNHEIFKNLALVTHPVSSRASERDPNLRLAQMITGAVKVKASEWHKGDSEQVIALTTKNQFDQATAEIAYLLYQNGIINDEEAQTQVPETLREKIRRVLTSAKNNVANPDSLHLHFWVLGENVDLRKKSLVKLLKLHNDKVNFCKQGLLI